MPREPPAQRGVGMVARLHGCPHGPKVAETVNFEHIKKHYYQSHRAINPTGIVPMGPAIDFSVPHGRGR